jgi:hypothetical protein
MSTNTTFCIHLSQIPGFNDILNIKEEKERESEKEGEQETPNILKLNKVVCKTSNNQVYKVIRYDKPFLNFDLISTYGLCRSVIANSDNKVVSFSPPKSVKSDCFMEKYPEIEEDIYAEEFIEGTMINVFWDPRLGLSGAWEIATRNTVGATSSFYKSPHSKSFRTMFLEAAKENNLILEELNSSYSYSFVLQHPENRIVVPFKKPQLYLIGIYSIDNSDKNNISVYSVKRNEIQHTYGYNASIQFPQTIAFATYSELREKYASMNTPYHVLGVMIYNAKTGERTKMRNPVYEQVRNLRGNQSKLQYQYICLRKEGKVGDFLRFYPEYKKECSSFRDQIHAFTHTLYSNYISCYIKKEKPLIEFGEQFRTHMYVLHQIYINDLREKKKSITNTTVIHYVNDIQPSLLMYCLNYHMRQRQVDHIVADNASLVECVSL